MTSEPVIRPLQQTDIAAVTAIYVHYVSTTTATFEIEPPDADEMWRRAGAVLERGLPYLVAEAGNAVRGYAYAAPHRPRPGYAGTVESSVYVAPDFARKGIGRMLMERVIYQCRRSGFHRMLAGVGGSDNAASLGLHRALGFRYVGTFNEVGFKFGRYVNTHFFEFELE